MSQSNKSKTKTSVEEEESEEEEEPEDILIKPKDLIVSGYLFRVTDVGLVPTGEQQAEMAA